MKRNDYNKQYYENDILWNSNSKVNSQSSRIESTYLLIPKDVGSIIDVGCGNGLFLNYIKKYYGSGFKKLLGVDISSTALKYVETDKIESDIIDLPLDNNSFDLVSALEVIEHLAVGEYEKGLKELVRVSKKYILISVPFNQVLEDTLIICPKCKSHFSHCYHKRCFNINTMNTLLKDHNCRLVNIHYEGKVEYLVLLHDILRKLRNYRNRLKPPSMETLCPVCGFILKPRLNNNTHHKEKNRTRFSIKLIIRFIKNYWPKKVSYKWVICLYEKNARYV